MVWCWPLVKRRHWTNSGIESVSLEEVNLMFWIQVNDRSPPIGRPPQPITGTATFALAGLRAHLIDLDIKQLFNSCLDLRLRRHPVNLKGVFIVPRGTVNTFFSHKRTQQDLMRLELDFCFRLNRWLNSCHRSNSCVSMCESDWT